MSILIFIIILVLLILVHELGHFLVAKWSGIRVDEFGIGFPPKIKGWKPESSETEYTLNWIPFGGFVKIFGEDPANEEVQSGVDSERCMINKPRYIQAAVIVAGVVFNVLFAWLLISIGFMSGLPTPVSSAPVGAVVENARLVITSVQEDSPAGVAGMKVGDVVLELSTNTASEQNMTPDSLSDFVLAHGSEEIAILYKRGQDITGTFFVIPESGILEGRPAIGVGMDMIGTLSLSLHHAVWEGGKTTIALTGTIAVGFWSLITDAFSGGADFKNLAGPVGIVGLVGDAADFGFA